MAERAAIQDEHLRHLVQQILGGSRDAVGELYIAFAGDVFRVAHYVLRSVPDAEEITDDVFLRVPVALRSYDHCSIYGFRKWIERITLRLAAAHANRLDTAREVPWNSVRAPIACADHPIDRLALECAIARLTPALRSVLLLKVVEGYSHLEISAMLGISVRASEVRLHRARRELHAQLGDGA